jgi:hypothetical protein
MDDRSDRRCGFGAVRRTGFPAAGRFRVSIFAIERWCATLTFSPVNRRFLSILGDSLSMAGRIRPMVLKMRAMQRPRPTSGAQTTRVRDASGDKKGHKSGQKVIPQIACNGVHAKALRTRSELDSISRL